VVQPLGHPDPGVERPPHREGEALRVLDLDLGIAAADRAAPRSREGWSRSQRDRVSHGQAPFAEASEHEAEAIRLAEPTQYAHTVGIVHWAAATLHLLKGDWAKARSPIEHWIAAVRTGNVVLLLPAALASSTWVLAQLGEADEALNRLREGEQLLERSVATGIVGNLA
jgi:tetratricopeptide (TPR) repeat protein